MVSVDAKLLYFFQPFRGWQLREVETSELWCSLQWKFFSSGGCPCIVLYHRAAQWAICSIANPSITFVTLTAPNNLKVSLKMVLIYCLFLCASRHVCWNLIIQSIKIPAVVLVCASQHTHKGFEWSWGDSTDQEPWHMESGPRAVNCVLVHTELLQTACLHCVLGLQPGSAVLWVFMPPK